MTEPSVDGRLVEALVRELERSTTRPWSVMEVCGGQTHAIAQFGLEDLLPRQVRLLHGPGCPVCVTAASDIDLAVALANTPQTLVCCFGDMMRVPGSTVSLLQARAHGARVQVVYSPLDALRIAAKDQDTQVVFFAVGFETTVPSTAFTLMAAAAKGLRNFTILCSHVQVPAALRLLLDDPECEIDGFLAAGHVCTVMGLEQYEPIARTYRVPIVATGFEPADILRGLLSCVRQLEQGTYEVSNEYGRLVASSGNLSARAAIDEVFEDVGRDWRGLGLIEHGGYALRSKYEAFDARIRFTHPQSLSLSSSECISGLVLRGKKRPDECPAFGRTCTREHPLGAPMVSSEGACAAYALYRSTHTSPDTVHD